MRTTSKFGWVPDLPDHRDKLAYHKGSLNLDTLPVAVSLQEALPAVYDQGQLGSCVGNAVAAAIDFERKKQGWRFMAPARLFIYYNARDMEGSAASDSGCMIRDAIKSVAAQGVCVEGFWPYSVPFDEKPNPLCYDTAVRHKTLQYLACQQDEVNLKGYLAAGWPVVFGFTVYDSFMSDAVAASGIVPMPAPNEVVAGGHAVLACGYDDLTAPTGLPNLTRPPLPSLLCRNSWGTVWGMAGYFWLPFQYVADPNLADDLWSIRLE